MVLDYSLYYSDSLYLNFRSFSPILTINIFSIYSMVQLNYCNCNCIVLTSIHDKPYFFEELPMHWCLEETRDSLTKSLHIFIPCILIECFYDLRFLLIIISQVVIQLRGKSQLKSIKRIMCHCEKESLYENSTANISIHSTTKKYRLKQNLKEAIRSKNSQVRGYQIPAFVIKLVTIHYWSN